MDDAVLPLAEASTLRIWWLRRLDAYEYSTATARVAYNGNNGRAFPFTPDRSKVRYLVRSLADTTILGKTRRSRTECQAIPSLTYGRDPAARGSPASKALPSH
jgi:hypothetical protein